jgi:uncharacterized protein
MKPLLRAGLILACVAFSALAVDWKTYKPQGYVSDFAGVVDAQSRAAIESYAGNVQRATGAQMALVTIPSLEGEPIEDVANDIFHAWGVGQKTEDNGVMLLLSIGDRKSRLEVGGGLGGEIPDSMAGDILDEMRPALRQRQYGPALFAAAEKIGSTIAQAQGVSIPAPTAVRRVPRGTRDTIPWPLIFLGIFFLLVLLRGGGGRRGGYGGYGGGGGGFWTGLLLGQILNSGRRYPGGGGGFGGYDSGNSGGGFGGFGGGDSAGGGASSDW